MSSEAEVDLSQAIGARDLAKVRSALSRGANPNNVRFPPMSALHITATIGPVQVLDELIRAGADVNSRDEDRGRTPLHSAATAAAEDAPAMIDRLVEAGADVNASDINGYTPLDVAIAYRDKTCARRLYQLGGVSRRYTQDIIKDAVSNGKEPRLGRG